MTALLAVTLVSMLLAVVMSVIAWRVAREERARSQARVAALADDIEQTVAAAGGRRSDPASYPAPLRAVRTPPAVAADLFTATPTRGSSRSVVVVGIGLFAFAMAAALAVVLSSGMASPVRPTDLPHATDRGHATSSPQPAVGPLDLVAMGEERDGDRLVVRGVVRNPSPTPADRVTAVVFAFDRDGEFLSSGRAALDAPLPSGGESSFTVTVEGARNAARYRISFRTDTAIVPHVDKRHAE